MGACASFCLGAWRPRVSGLFGVSLFGGIGEVLIGYLFVMVGGLGGLCECKLGLREVYDDRSVEDDRECREGGFMYKFRDWTFKGRIGPLQCK